MDQTHDQQSTQSCEYHLLESDQKTAAVPLFAHNILYMSRSVDKLNIIIILIGVFYARVKDFMKCGAILYVHQDDYIKI